MEESQKGTRGERQEDPFGGVAVQAKREGYSGLGERHQIEHVNGLE